MLRKAKDLYGFSIDATDGNIGKVDNFLFEDTTWKIRYLVVDTGTWLPDRKVLIPFASLCPPNAQMSIFPVKLTKKQVSDSPDIDTDKPVSLQHQITLDGYYQSIPLPMGIPGVSVMPATVKMSSPQPSGDDKQYDPHLRSARHVVDYHLEASDYRFGSIADFIIDDESWTIPYLVVDTINWLPSKWVLAPSSQVTKISWEERKVDVGLSGEIIKNGPRYQPSIPIDRQYEEQLREYYACQGAEYKR